MTDELTKLRPLDTLHINIDAAHELRWWSAQLHTSIEKIKEAVNAVGTSVYAVRKYLKI